MSRPNCDLIRGKLSFVPLLHPYGARVAACTLLLIGALLTASCGFLGQSAGAQGQGLTVSGTFPEGVAHQTYNAVLTVSGGNAPYQFAVKSGSLPPGVNLNSATGSVSGTPTAAGSYVFQVGVTDDPLPHRGSQNFAISIGTQGGGGIHVTVSPTSINMPSGQVQAFTAAVTGADNTAVTWAASAGSITSSGSFTAPVVSGVTTVYVTATSNVDTRIRGVATVVVEPVNAQAPAITTSTLPDGRTGNAYDAGFTATGGTLPYSWTVSQGKIPQGLTLNQSDGQLAGMPGTPGGYSFSIKVTDAKAQTAQKAFTLNVAADGNLDGPAELPRVTVSSSMADTPAPGTVIVVNAGGDLQAALKNAHCGDTIELQAGATFTGTFDFPAKSCDDNHWIIVRTSAPDGALPAEGQRMTPCYAGVTSLPGRPAYSCTNSQNVLAKLQLPSDGGSPVTFLSGANHYRLLGLEITRPAGGKGAPTLVTLDQTASADHIILDRVWLHGTAHDDTRVGFLLKGSNYVAVVDSYLNDFHCTSGTGACTDAHAIGGGNGDHQDGPYKIENNFLEASGESIMFGGGAATVTPTDIVVRRNHFFKPIEWMKGQPNFVGGVSGNPFIVKNHLELKNAIRVLIEANLMENSWGGFTQTGRAIVLSPKNQRNKKDIYVCPLCQVTDVTIRYVRIAHAGGGMAFVTGCDLGCQNTKDGNNGGQAQAGGRFSIHDVVLDDISKSYVGSGTLFELLNGWLKNPLNNVTINHITGFPDADSHLLSIGNLISNPLMTGLVFTNNMVLTGRYPIWATGGGQDSCAYSGTPAQKIANCFTTNKFTNNALIATPDAFPPSSWPSGNFFPANPNTVGFARYQEGGGGDYELKPSSTYKNAGTDGRDLGADIVGLEAALAGIE
jgi:hypothetical protein